MLTEGEPSENGSPCGFPVGFLFVISATLNKPETYAEGTAKPVRGPGRHQPATAWVLRGSHGIPCGIPTRRCSAKWAGL